jgi:hypothetical protein
MAQTGVNLEHVQVGTITITVTVGLNAPEI